MGKPVGGIIADHRPPLALCQNLAEIHVNNQFGLEQLDTVKEEELCVPSLKTVQ